MIFYYHLCLITYAIFWGLITIAVMHFLLGIVLEPIGLFYLTVMYYCSCLLKLPFLITSKFWGEDDNNKDKDNHNK